MIAWPLFLLVTTPSSAELSETWAQYMTAPAALAKSLGVRPTAEEWRRLSANEVLKWRLPPAAGFTDVIVAMTYIDQPVDMVWVGLLDDRHATLISDLVEHRLPSSTSGRKILYQRVDLPFPLSDRHWVLAIENNLALYGAFGGKVWERTWDLDERGEDALVELPAELRVDLNNIVWPPEARGGWVLLTVGWGTLLMYHVQTNIGGYIPAEWVTRYGMSKLDEMLEQADRLATRVPHHYKTGHQTFRRPDGSIIEPFGN